eukprot:Transcript_28996.p2 GENE.Transcript_28996~~Transcript_28996.p2  ORF type:complete len:233 (-),score=114.31 Transcript_28996:258-956(-)
MMLARWNLAQFGNDHALDDLLSNADVNSDGKLEFSEFAKYLVPPDFDHKAAANPLMAQSGTNPQPKYQPIVPRPPPIKRRATEQELERYRAQISDKIYTKWKMLAGAFRALDEDKSGFLSKEEVIEAVGNFNLPIPRHHIVQLVDEYAIDVDGDGRVDYDEFAKALKRQDYGTAPLLEGDADNIVSFDNHSAEAKPARNLGLLRQDWQRHGQDVLARVQGNVVASRPPPRSP